MLFRHENSTFAQYFNGQSYLNMLSLEQVVIGNVTFEPVPDEEYESLK